MSNETTVNIISAIMATYASLLLVTSTVTIYLLYLNYQQVKRIEKEFKVIKQDTRLLKLLVFKLLTNIKHPYEYFEN
jgi:Na+/pantothenate symporter